MSRGDGSDDSDIDLLVTLASGTSALALGNGSRKASHGQVSDNPKHLPSFTAGGLGVS